MDPQNNRPKPQLILTIVEMNSMRLTIDMSKTPSMDYAINMLEQALRTLRNEQANGSSVAFMNRLARENNEAAAMSAMQTGKRM